MTEYFCPVPPSVVLVQSPEVYTRARLLNDRITQQNWLKKQFREDDDEDERQKKFATPEVVEHLRERLLLDLALSSRPASPQAATSTAPTPPTPTLDSSGDKSRLPALSQPPIGISTPSQIFQAQREFRQLVRAELFRTQLDDRHDLDGNTAYTLRFPTSVVGPAKPGLVALVDLSVSHPLVGKPKEERRVHEALAYLKDSFEDWRKYVQASYTTSISALVKALSEVRERNFSGAEPSLREIGFSAGDVRDYFVHKLLCRQNVYFCPPHERDRYAISDWPQLPFLGSRTKTPGSPPMDGSAFSQDEAQTVQYAMHRLDAYLVKHSEATREAVTRTYYLRRAERLKGFDGRVQAGRIIDRGSVRREIPIEEAIERCRVSRGIPPGELQGAEFRVSLPYVEASESVQIVDEGKGVKTVAVAVWMHESKQLPGGTSAPTPTAGQTGSKEPSANGSLGKVWIPIADCPRSPGVYADVREIFRLLRSHRFGPDPYQEYQGSGDQNWPTKLGLVDELLKGQENDGLSPAWPNWSRKPANGTGSGLLGDSAILRVREFFNRLEARLDRCREELRREDPAKPDSWKSLTSGCADIVAPTGVAPGQQEATVSRGAPFNWLGEARTTCAAADFTAYQASWPTYIGPDGHAISFSHFFDVIPVRYGLHGCDIEVRAKGQGAKGTALSGSLPTYCKDYGLPSQGVMTISYEAALCRLLDLVMEDAEFFAYALVPSIEFRRVGQSEDMLASAAFSSKDSLAPLVAVLLQQQHERSRATVKSAATVASYINWPATDSTDGRMQTTANFGWALLPDPTAANARHFDLSASLSVPGWMKHALITVRACWLRVDEVEAQIKRWSKSLGGPCEGSSYNFKIPLPGDSSEINRKLNMAVIKVPHVKALDGLTNEPPRLRAGFPGTIVIPGRRLWKNAAVTLGDQLADDILVLPDMEGIVAKFDCVNVPLESSAFAIWENPDNPPLRTPGPLQSKPTPANEPPKPSGTDSKPPAGIEASAPPQSVPPDGMQQDADSSGRGDGQRAPIVKMTARVWTSEGTTVPIDVFVSTFGKFDLCPRQRPPRTPVSR